MHTMKSGKRIRLRYPRRHPIFARLKEDGRSQVWLARRIGYSVAHVYAVAAGHSPPGSRFRAECARVMHLPEEELFHPADTSIAASPVETDGLNRDGTATGALYSAPQVTSRRSA